MPFCEICKQTFSAKTYKRLLKQFNLWNSKICKQKQAKIESERKRSYSSKKEIEGEENKTQLLSEKK